MEITTSYVGTPRYQIVGGGEHYRPDGYRLQRVGADQQRRMRPIRPFGRAMHQYLCVKGKRQSSVLSLWSRQRRR